MQNLSRDGRKIEGQKVIGIKTNKQRMKEKRTQMDTGIEL
jgi:hypothetical protein